MDRPRRDSRQQNGITVRRLSQLTFATKSAQSRRADGQPRWRLGAMRTSLALRPHRGITTDAENSGQHHGHASVERVTATGDSNAFQKISSSNRKATARRISYAVFPLWNATNVHFCTFLSGTISGLPRVVLRRAKFRVEEVQWRTEIPATLMQPTTAQSVRK